MKLRATNLGPKILIFTEAKLLSYVDNSRFAPNEHADFPAEFRRTSVQLRGWSAAGLVELRIVDGDINEGDGAGSRRGIMASDINVLPNDIALIQRTNVQDYLDDVEGILASGGSGSGTKYKVEEFILSPSDISAKFVSLSIQPSNTNITVSIRNGPPQGYGQDYILSGKNVSWAGRGLEGVVMAGDELIIGYEHSGP